MGSRSAARLGAASLRRKAAAEGRNNTPSQKSHPDLTPRILTNRVRPAPVRFNINGEAIADHLEQSADVTRGQHRRRSTSKEDRGELQLCRLSPAQSHFTFDFLGSFTTLEALNGSPSSEWGWWNLSYHTYLTLAEGVSVDALQEQLRELPSRYIGDQEERSGYRQFLYPMVCTDPRTRINSISFSG